MRSKRIDLVENYIINHKTVSIDKLCEVFDVSKNTIRRDLSVLVEKGTIKKVYGGVTVNENQELVSFEERNVTVTAASMITRAINTICAPERMI